MKMSRRRAGARGGARRRHARLVVDAEHSTSVETTVSKLASSKGRSSAGARRTVAAGATCSRAAARSRLQHRRLRLGDRERPRRPRRSRPRFAPVPPPISSTSPLAPAIRSSRSRRARRSSPWLKRSYVSAKNLLRKTHRCLPAIELRNLRRAESGRVGHLPHLSAERPSRGSDRAGRRTGSPRPAGRAGLGVDVLDVVARGLRRDHQLLGDLLIGKAEREQPQDLDLARGQPGGPRHSGGGRRARPTRARPRPHRGRTGPTAPLRAVEPRRPPRQTESVRPEEV